MKTAVITGASRGIGKATAEVFAKNGYNTVICYNNSRVNKNLQVLLSQIATFPQTLRPHHLR